MSVRVIRTLAEMRDCTATWRAEGARIGVVPTMGALHAGHLSLVAAAKAACDRVIVWIFVNPKQFNNPEDLKTYPRTEDDDLAQLGACQVDVVYMPSPDQVYPDGFATAVTVAGLTDVLCGAARPGHFEGVATVVSKIFLQTGADMAFFGEKDFQQLQVVRRLARDLDIPIEVIGCPTVREASGLALSSRNLRLSPDGRDRAGALSLVMRDVAQALAAGEDFAPLAAAARARLTKAGFTEIDYFDLRDESRLQSLDRAGGRARLFAAAWIEGVRLIDNIPVPPA